MSQNSGRAVRAANFLESIGINVHMEYTDGAYANTGNVAQDLAYLGIGNIRDMIPNVPAGGVPAANEVSALETLAADGVRMDLFVGANETDIAADIAIANGLDAATPGAVEAIEGLNEINNNAVNYNGLTGQAGADAEQAAIYAAVTADSTLSGAAVFDYTGGATSNATPYGTLTENADGSDTLVNGITGWMVTLPTGVTTVTINYTGAAPLAGLFGYPGQAQETGLTQGANGTLSFTYDNTSGAPMQTYVTASAWNQTTTFTAVSAVAAGSAVNLVDFNPVANLAGAATDANIHPYPSGGAVPDSYIAANFIDAYGTAAPGPAVITEDGYDTDPNDPNGVSQTEQARGDLDMLLDGYASGASQTYLYELLDEKPDPNDTNSEMHFGLFNNDNTPKLAATAIHDLTAILADNGQAATSFATGTLAWSSADLPTTAQTLLMETSNGAFDLAAWNETSLGSPVSAVSTIALGADYQSVAIYDPLSGTAPIETLSNVAQVTVTLAGDPLIVQVEPALSTLAPAEVSAVRVSDFVKSIGINVHMEYTDGAYANTGDVAQDLSYLGVSNIRDMIPNVPAGGVPAANEVSALETLAAGGVRDDLFVGASETSIAADIGILNELDAANPGSVEAVEGLNEINNNPPSYAGLTGQAAATAEQDALMAAVKADATLSGAAVFDYTGGSPTNATPYGTLTRNADGSDTLVNGITGWLVDLPTGVTNVTITYTGASPLAGLFGYPGAAQETGLTQGVNGTLSFSYDNTSGAPMQTYVTASAWNQTTTFTSVSAVAAGSSQNMVNFNPVLNLAAEATDANAHPYPSGGATPGADIASAFVGPYGTATPGPGVITEDGYNTDPNDSNGVSQIAQARGDLDILLDGYADGMSQTYLYELLDEKPDPSDSNSEMHFGLFNNDNTPKLAATALHDLTTILADGGSDAGSFATGGMDISTSGLPATGKTLLMEKSDGAFDLAVWNETSLASPVMAAPTIALGGLHRNVEIFDPLSGTAAVQSLSNVSQVTLSLGGDPLIVEIEPQLAGANPAPCFMAGTRIATARGEMDVSGLAIGDEVRTLSGALRRIKWLGRRRYAQPFPRNMVDIIPVLICRGALGPGVPARDLYVSPLHAMYLENVLVPAGLLINGRSIRSCPDFAEVEYIHIELDSHDVIFAEGAAAETFVDCDSRAIFQNAAEFAALYPADESPSWAFCAPRVEGGQTLRRIWRGLAARAGLTMRVPPLTARLEGTIDRLEHDRIEGWAWLPDFPEEFVELEVLDFDGVIARVVAERHRDDLAEAGIGDGRHAFGLTFRTGLAADRPHEIHIRRADGGPELPGSPLLLRAVAAAPAGPALLRQGAAPQAAAAKRALVLDLWWPVPGRDAGSRAMLSHIEGLRRLGYEVDLVAVDEFAACPPAALAGEARCRTAQEFPAVETLLQREGAAYALVYMHRLPVVARYAGLVRAHCRGPDGRGAHLVYGVADLHHVRLERQARIEEDASLARFAQATRRHEIAALRQADCVITHSFDEADYIERIVPEAHVRVVPWAVPVRPPAVRGAQEGVLFVGNFDHAPNPDAVRWLLADIMPEVWRFAPHVSCMIAGAGWPRQALPKLDDRVRLLGHVAELDALYGRVRLAVAPLRFGAGVKGKVLESFAAGVPCVMTEVAAEGIPLSGLLRELVAGRAESFARLICRLHDDEAFNAAAAAAGREMIAAQFHDGRVLEELRRAAAPRRRAAAPAGG